MDFVTNTLVLSGYVSDTVALAAVALIGYLVGHRTRQQRVVIKDQKLRDGLSRAVHIAKELQLVAGRIRREVAQHESRISRFQSQVGDAQNCEVGPAWQTLTSEAEELLAPTMKLASNLSAAYDQLRLHSSQLMTFTGSWSDLETGVGNRRALEEQLQVQLTAYRENKSRFSLALFSIDSSEPELIREFALLLERSARDTDLVCRYGQCEFVVLMAQTTLAGATVFSERLLREATAEFSGEVDGGIVEVQSGDTSAKLLSRADSALYSARSSTSSCLFVHNGKVLRQLEGTAPANQAEEFQQPVGSAPTGSGDWDL